MYKTVSAQLHAPSSHARTGCRSGKFECPNPLYGPALRRKLEQVKGLLPNVNAMADVGLLNVAIGTLRRDGMSKSLIIDHLIGVYCPMIARDASVD